MKKRLAFSQRIIKKGDFYILEKKNELVNFVNMIILLNFARCKKSILLKTSGKGIRMPFLGVITFLVHIQAF